MSRFLKGVNMTLNETLSRLARDFVQRKITVKTIPDETRSRTYEGTIIGVAYRHNENAIVFFTDQIGFAEIVAHLSQGKNKPWYSIKYGSGDQLEDMVKVPLIDGTTPLNELLGEYLEKGIDSNSYQDLSDRVCPELKTNFLRFVNTGEAANEYLVHLEHCHKCNTAVELAFQRQATAFESLARFLRNKSSKK